MVTNTRYLQRKCLGQVLSLLQTLDASDSDPVRVGGGGGRGAPAGAGGGQTRDILSFR